MHTSLRTLNRIFRASLSPWELRLSSLYLFLSLGLWCFSFQGELTNGRSKFHVLFLLFVAVMFFVSLMFLFGYHCWLVSRNRSTLGKALGLCFLKEDTPKVPLVLREGRFKIVAECCRDLSLQMSCIYRWCEKGSVGEVRALKCKSPVITMSCIRAFAVR